MSFKNIFIIICFFPVLALIGCQAGTREMPSDESGYAALNEQLAREQKHLQQARQKQTDTLEHSPAQKDPEEKIEPFLPEFNPLQENIVSISIHNRPLHDVLYVIARDAGLNLVISPGISLEDRVTISFDKTRASVVVDRLLDAYDLAWEVHENVLAVRPFQEEVFHLDFLNSNTQVSINSGGNIFGGSGIDGDHNLTGNFSMESDFGGGDDDNSIYGFLRTNLDEILSAEAGGAQGRFVLDPTAGTLYVRASPQKMKIARRFVQQLKDKLSQQVVIDAQILEVVLNDSFQLGVDWSYVTQRLIRGYGYDINIGWQEQLGFGTYELGQEDPQPLIITRDTDNISKSSDFSATIQALETFGTVHVVSNPHVRTRHLQPALVTSGTTRNYVKEITRETETDNNTITGYSYSTETASAFEGVMLGVVPFITDNGDVDLNIFPITSKVDLETESEFGDNKITLPKVDIRNVNTNVRVNDGDTVILGGLIQKLGNESDRGTPGVSKVPGLGWLFKKRDDSRQLSELVVIMHVRMLSP